MSDIVRCKGKCLHETKDLEKSEAIRDGNSYYHPDCYKAKQDALEIIDIWSKKVNPLCNFAQLRRAINDIIYNKKVDSGMLLYGLKMYVDKKIPLHYPGGLYYIIQNHEVQRSWIKLQFLSTPKEREDDLEVVDNQPEIEQEKPFDYEVKKTVGFEDILRSKVKE